MRRFTFRKRSKPPVFVMKTGGFGPSSATRTRGLMLPKHPPYQLGYTRIQDIKFVGMWSNMWSEEFYHKFPELSRGESGDICGDFGLVPIFSERWRKRSPGSQTRRPTSWATPGYQKHIIHQQKEKCNHKVIGETVVFLSGRGYNGRKGGGFYEISNRQKRAYRFGRHEADHSYLGQ